MRHLVLSAVLGVACLFPARALAQVPPDEASPSDSAKQRQWFGGALVGVGTLALASTPLCQLTHGARQDLQPTCTLMSLVPGTILMAVGLPLLMLRTRASVLPTAGGAVLTLQW